MCIKQHLGQKFYVQQDIIVDFLMVYNTLKIRMKDQLLIIKLIIMGLNKFRMVTVSSFDDMIIAKFMVLNVSNES